MLTLKVQTCTSHLMEQLEARQCIERLRLPRPGAMQVPLGGVVDAPVYVSRPEFGPHMLLCVGVDFRTPRLVVHPDREEFLLINDGRRTRPLVLVVSLLSRNELETRAHNGSLTAQDLVAIELKFNDPVLSFFTMREGIPHGEFVLDGPGETPYFFVTESRDLPSHEVDMKGITLTVIR